MDSWKRLTQVGRIRLLVRTDVLMKERLKFGQNKYGESLTKADPLREIEEELVDALAYLEWGRRQREAIRLIAEESLTGEAYAPSARDALTQIVKIIDGEDR